MLSGTAQLWGGGPVTPLTWRHRRPAGHLGPASGYGGPTSCLHLPLCSPVAARGPCLPSPHSGDSSGHRVPRAPGGGGANGPRPSQWPTGKPRQAAKGRDPFLKVRARSASWGARRPDSSPPEVCHPLPAAAVRSPRAAGEVGSGGSGRARAASAGRGADKGGGGWRASERGGRDKARRGVGGGFSRRRPRARGANGRARGGGRRGRRRGGEAAAAARPGTTGGGGSSRPRLSHPRRSPSERPPAPRRRPGPVRPTAAGGEGGAERGGAGGAWRFARRTLAGTPGLASVPLGRPGVGWDRVWGVPRSRRGGRGRGPAGGAGGRAERSAVQGLDVSPGRGSGGSGGARAGPLPTSPHPRRGSPPVGSRRGHRGAPCPPATPANFVLSPHMFPLRDPVPLGELLEGRAG